jgi:hypothetical protein
MCATSGNALGPNQKTSLQSSRGFKLQAPKEVNPGRNLAKPGCESSQKSGLWSAELDNVRLEMAQQAPDTDKNDNVG